MRNPPIEQKDVLQALDKVEEAITLDHHHPTSPMAASSSSILQKSKHSPSSPRRHNSSKFLLRILVVSAFLFLLFQIHTLHVQHLPQTNNPSTSLANFSWPSSLNPFVSTCRNQSVVVDHEFSSKALQKLRQSVTFLPLKDLRYAESALVGHTWFMSSLYDSHVEGEVQYQKFPSESSNGRLLCMKGHDNHDGSWNYYGLAWPGALPENATLAKGLTFVSYNHYDYSNIWHGLSAVIPFGAWHLRNGCRIPARWVLYHWGELRVRMGPWLTTLMEAVYGADGVKIEEFKGVEETTPVCFEEAVVMRHNEGGMSRLRREQVYDLLRCKARAYCNVSADKSSEVVVGVTMFMRSGGRSFKNDSHVIRIFDKECRKIEGCRLQVAYSNNLTVCQQVKIMSETDVLISPHGAQLTNMFLMDKGSSVMEFFPKGWLKLAGVGQYVYHWIASWSGMRHQGAWRDSEGPPCEFPEDDRRCMTLYKNAQIGHNETHFIEWSQTVFREVRVRKLNEASMPSESEKIGCGCA
ncbi:hypothetical protein V2J09_000190 [Rumex salicifolius]